MTFFNKASRLQQRKIQLHPTFFLVVPLLYTVHVYDTHKSPFHLFSYKHMGLFAVWGIAINMTVFSVHCPPTLYENWSGARYSSFRRLLLNEAGSCGRQTGLYWFAVHKSTVSLSGYRQILLTKHGGYFCRGKRKIFDSIWFCYLLKRRCLSVRCRIMRSGMWIMRFWTQKGYFNCDIWEPTWA